MDQTMKKGAANIKRSSLETHATLKINNNNFREVTRLVCRMPCSGQAQCTSRRDFAPFTPSTHRAFHGERADKSGCGGLGDGCEVRSAKTRHNTNCFNQGNIKRAQGCCPWSPPQGGARDQSASARRGLPCMGEARALHHQPRPSIDLDHALPLLSSSHWLLDH